MNGMPMPMPAPVEQSPKPGPKEGGELGGATQAPDYGLAVNSFNDKSSARPGSGDISSLLDSIADRIEKGEYGPPSQGSDRPVYDNPTMGGASRTDQAGGFRGDHQAAGMDIPPPGDFGRPRDEAGGGSPGMEFGGGQSHQDAGDEGAAKNILQQGSIGSGDSGSRDMGPEGPNRSDNQPDDSNEGASGGENVRGEKGISEKKDDGYWKRIGDQMWRWKPSHEGQNVPGDNLLKRMERNELTMDDMKKLEADYKRQMQTSVVPSQTGTQKGSPGSGHANPKQTGPSPLAQYQGEIKAREAKWDAVQSWNHKSIQRAEAQQDEMWARLRKMNKG
jgi:hypothetical protein